jgi:glycosyltransferase involved in cell wall biosynthesis
VFGGTQGGRWVVEQLDALRDQGCECVAILAGETGSTVDLCREAGLRVKAFDFSLFGWRGLLRYPIEVIRMAWWMRRERFDVVQSHVLTSTLFGRPAAWLADIPVRLVMVTSPFYIRAPTLRWVERATAWMETGIIPSCRLTADLYRDAGVSDCLIQPTLYYGPPSDRFDPEHATPEGLRTEFGLAPDVPLIGAVAIFYPKSIVSSFVPPEVRDRYIKGHPDLIRAMHHVLREFPKARLVLVGSGWGPAGPQVEEEMRAIVRDEGLEDVIIFAGWRKSASGVYLDLDVSVQASVYDNLGGTIESLLMARPTVATRVGGMVDSVIDGRTGILVSPEDPADIARGIIEMLRDPERAAAMGRAGRELMLSGFTLETTVPELAALYRRQRAAARGAFRPLMSIGRLFVTGLLAVPILTRGLFDIYLRQVRFRRTRRWIGERAARLTRWLPPGSPRL